MLQTQEDSFWLHRPCKKKHAMYALFALFLRLQVLMAASMKTILNMPCFCFHTDPNELTTPVKILIVM
jgi:hypothetical protein